MSETLSGDEELETASVEPVSETPSEDDAARDDDRGALELGARLDALEACTVELLRRFDESKRNMDRYYHAFLELETVVNQLAENQNRLTEFVQSVPGGAGAGPSGAPAAGAFFGAMTTTKPLSETPDFSSVSSSFRTFPCDARGERRGARSAV